MLGFKTVGPDLDGFKTVGLVLFICFQWGNRVYPPKRWMVLLSSSRLSGSFRSMVSLIGPRFRQWMLRVVLVGWIRRRCLVTI